MKYIFKSGLLLYIIFQVIIDPRDLFRVIYGDILHDFEQPQHNASCGCTTVYSTSPQTMNNRKGQVGRISFLTSKHYSPLFCCLCELFKYKA